MIKDTFPATDLLLIRQVLEHEGIPKTPRLSDVEEDTQEFDSDSTVEILVILPLMRTEHRRQVSSRQSSLT